MINLIRFKVECRGHQFVKFLRKKMNEKNRKNMVGPPIWLF